MQKINLIPEVKQQQLKTKKNNLLSTTFAIVMAVILGAIIVILFTYIVARKAQITSVDSQKATLNDQLKAYSGLEQTVLSLETGLTDIKTIINNDSKWINIFEEIEKDTPADVRFSSMKISADNTVTAEIQGKNVTTIDRFIKSFNNAQTAKNVNAFSPVEVNGYSSDNTSVTFSAKFSVNKDAF